MEIVLLAIIALPLLASLVVPFVARYPKALGYFTALCAFTCTLGLIYVGTTVSWSETHLVTVPWVPALGINLTFLVDGLSLFFGFLVTGMGTLVAVYSQHYMPTHHAHLGRFYSYLLFFMFAMLGTVFSDNLVALFVFWELTGVASFLLIGFSYYEEAARRGARVALLITSLTGLCLLAGVILLGLVMGTLNWNEMIRDGIPLTAHKGLVDTCLFLLLLGAFGKSAQMPLHFWLPNAMVAPTPVSAYLHAATMVKLGVFLTARLYPLFVETSLWLPLTATVCFTSMLLGAIFSLLSNKLKTILAYATISQVGFFIGFYGLGDAQGVQYDFVHILNHAFYKGSLFMLVGIVDHATGIKDIRKLGGLASRLPITAFAFLLAAAAMAGIPGSTGFLSKELLVADLVVLGQKETHGLIILAVVAFASVFKVAFSIRLFYHIFVRKPAEGAFIYVKPTGFWIHFSPLILSLAALIFGVWPTGLMSLTSAFYVSGLHALEQPSLSLWHGWTLELTISASILLSGIALFWLAERWNWVFAKIPSWLRLERGFETLLDKLITCSEKVTQIVHSRRLDRSLEIAALFFCCIRGGLPRAAQ